MNEFNTNAVKNDEQSSIQQQPVHIRIDPDYRDSIEIHVNSPNRIKIIANDYTHTQKVVNFMPRKKNFIQFRVSM